MTEDLGSLLIVDDDEPFRTTLGRAMQRRGFRVVLAGSFAAAIDLANDGTTPDFAAIDLRLGDGNGLELVNALRQIAPETRIVMLTGYGNIASAVSAIKAGAIDYLPKPVEADRLKAALLGVGQGEIEAGDEPMSPDRVKWEHIQRIYEETGNNLSETARRLKMYRRTLQRIMAKHAPQK